MKSNSRQLAAGLLGLATDQGFQRDVAQIRARAVLTEIAGGAPEYQWTYLPTRLARNLTAAIVDLERLHTDGTPEPDGVITAARQVAAAWESLARLEERRDREPALINAAAAYDLAGYQANAVSIARQMSAKLDDDRLPDFAELAALFLQRQLIRAAYLSSLLIREPTTPNAFDETFLQAAATAMGAVGIQHAARYLLSGQTQFLRDAGESLALAEEAFSSVDLILEANTAHAIRSLLPAIRARSTWTVLGGLLPGNSRWQRYLKLLARGLKQSVFTSTSVSELWPSQLEALRNGLLDQNDSKIVKMPTSAGKTRIAELAMAHTLIADPNSKCIYVAPYRALVAELEEAFFNIFADLGFRVSSIVGTYESDDFEQLLSTDANVLVVTPEKLDLLQRLRPDFLDRVRLCIVDEGHIIGDRTRGVKVELLLTRLMRRLLGAHFIFLSAVMPTESLEDFATWLRTSSAGIVTSNWRPAILRVAKLEWRGETGVLRYARTEDDSLLSEFVPGIIREQTYGFVNPETGRLNRPRFPDVHSKAQIAAELAFKYSELGPVLVFCAQRNHALTVGRALSARLDLVRRQERSVPAWFQARATRSRLVSEEWLGENHPVTQLLEQGIAVHHGEIPHAVREAIEHDFRNRHLRVIVATSTLAQGVNLPLRTVIVHSCWRRISGDQGERILARDYWNIAGRAGRAGEETEGTVIHIVLTGQDERDYQYYLSKREEPEPIESALLQLIQDVVHQRTSEAAIAGLDPDILALLVEEGIESVDSDKLESFIQDTLASTQAHRYGLSRIQIEQPVRQVAAEILVSVPQPMRRALYSTTGLGTRSCELLRAHVDKHLGEVRRLLTSATIADTGELVSLFIDATGDLEEMQPYREYSGDYEELLEQWITGTEIRELQRRFTEYSSSLEDLARFMEEYFVFRLPWGISSYIRIATNELGISSDDLSPVAEYFPSMVKYGVPTPQSTWAMSSGLPSRRLAVDMALTYEQEQGMGSPFDFHVWLGRWDIEQLREDFGLQGPLLEDVARFLGWSSTNELLQDGQSVDDVLPLDVVFRVAKDERARQAAVRSRTGMTVSFARDYDSRINRNAIRVYLDREFMGYLPRSAAQFLAPEMDSGLDLTGTILEAPPESETGVWLRVDRAG